MSFPRRFKFPLWLIAPVLAGGFVVWNGVARSHHLEHVTSIAEWSVNPPASDDGSPTGYARGQRRLIVPEHNNESYQWIAQTESMIARHELRSRHTDADNAPLGRANRRPSLYAGWLGLLAWFEHLFSGQPIARDVERAALCADPVLELIFMIAATAVIARQFNGWTAATFSLGAAGLFPFAANYFPGAPDHHGLAAICVAVSVLSLLPGLQELDDPEGGQRARRWFFLGGAAGGLGLWVSASSQLPILFGIAAGALIAARIARGTTARPLLPWRTWALGGCLVSLLGYMAEYYPAHMALQLEVNHPLYSLVWLGGGELLARGTAWLQRGKLRLTGAEVSAVAVALAALVAVPVLIVRTGSHGFWVEDPLASRLSQAGRVVAKNLGDWLIRDGFSAPLLATLLPSVLIGGAALLATRRKLSVTLRMSLVVSLAPATLALAFACAQLRWWSLVDAALLALLVPLSFALTRPEAPRRQRAMWAAALTVLLLPGLWQLLPPIGVAAQDALNETDVESIVERDLAHWLAQRAGASAGDVIALAPPDLTTTFNFHAGLRGLGTLDWENKEGLAAAVRIVSATSAAEALALVQQRGVTHIIIPSWDSFLDEYARLGSSLADRSFIAALKRWKPLPWLRPVPYHLPQIGGFEGQSVAVFEVVDEQEEPAMLGALADYFVEMGRLDDAADVRKQLQRFPGDLGALISVAQIDAGRGDATGFAQVLAPILAAVANGGDRTLVWERRLSLAVVLAQGKRPDLAREQLQRCLAEADENRLRTLSSGAIFRLMALAGKLGLTLPTPELQSYARSLVPPAARERL